MKKLILLLFIPLVSFGQGELAQLIRVAKMDIESFEIYALEKGYTLNEFVDEENFKGLEMQKGFGSTTEYLSVYSKWYNEKYKSVYQGEKQRRLPDIYGELKKMGFKLFDTESMTTDNGITSYVKEYKKGDRETISIYIFEGADTIEIAYAKHY